MKNLFFFVYFVHFVFFVIPLSYVLTRARSKLSGHSFNDAQMRTCWQHSVEAEIGLAQEAIVLFLCSFLTSMSGEHNVVHKLSRVEFVSCRYDKLDKQQPASFTHSLSTIPEDCDRTLVVPVVDDPTQKVSVASGWD